MHEDDLAAYPMRERLEKAEKDYGHKFDRAAITERLIATAADLESLGPCEDVLIVGYPSRIADTKNNVPIYSKGITSTSPGICYCGKPSFVADASAFPGSSGSPVFASASLESKAFRPKLLGVVNAGMWVPKEYTLPDNGGKTYKLPLPSGFASVLRADLLRDFRSLA